MAKITRKTAKIFGETASATGDANIGPYIGQFGSAKAGTYVGTTDIATIQALSAWSNGWVDAVTPTQQFPTLPEMTGVHKVLSYQNAYVLQQGIPEWDSATTYYTNGFCAYNGYIYKSKADNNLNHNPSSSTSYWEVYSAITGANTSLSNLTETGEAHFANPSLGNLNTTGEGRLHALKGYSDEGELLTDSEGYADVSRYIYSTFDDSKYRIVGTPNITLDGIASGFDDSNYFTTTVTASPTNFEIISKFRYKTLNTQQLIWSIGSYYTLIITSDNKVTLRLPNSDNSYYRTIISVTPSNTDSDYFVKVSVVGDNTYTYTSYDGVSWVLLSTNTTYSYQYLSNTTIAIGCVSGNSNPCLTNIDLKKFVVKSNGITVFCGNKTGIDAIKPDNYTVVGSPTVTIDGVASNFSNGNYVQTPVINFAKPWQIDLTTNITSYSNVRSIISANGGNCFSVNINSTGASVWYLSSNGSSWDIASGTTSTKTIQTGTNNTLSFGWDGSKYYYIVNGEREDILASSTALYNGTDAINLGVNRQGQSGIAGSINLNTVKAYSNTTLVYQACLKIPYMESATGAKVVDAPYRDRVTDAYNQYGHALYYTLSDTDFTLPMGEVYGFIQSTPHIQYSDVGGGSYYNVYSPDIRGKKLIEQGGQSTVGTSEGAWQQPTMSAANGVGGTAFGVEASGNSSIFYPWKMFNGVKGSTMDCWQANATTGWFTFYNPTAIKVTNLSITNHNNGSSVNAPTAGTVKGSNDNSTWTSIKSWTNSNVTDNATWNIDMTSNTNSYKYYKVEITSTGGGYVTIDEVAITATIQISGGSNYIAFPVQFNEADYYYLISPSTVTVTAKTTSGITLASGTSGTVFWEAKGY